MAPFGFIYFTGKGDCVVVLYAFLRILPSQFVKKIKFIATSLQAA
jgi:hypothetical protein